MRYRQFINTHILISDIKQYQRDREMIMMENRSKKINKKIKVDILTCVKILFSPNITIESNMIFVGDDISRLFDGRVYDNYSDKLIIEYKGIQYQAPVFMLSRCIEPRRFAKIMENINRKKNIEYISHLKFDLKDILA